MCLRQNRFHALPLKNLTIECGICLLKPGRLGTDRSKQLGILDGNGGLIYQTYSNLYFSLLRRFTMLKGNPTTEYGCSHGAPEQPKACVSSRPHREGGG